MRDRFAEQIALISHTAALFEEIHVSLGLYPLSDDV